MKLSSFRIINCFGFLDSGKVELSNPNNLIYILGRNSSGKSSLLNALKYLGKGIKPSEQPNFQNFNSNNESSFFAAEFSLENSPIDFGIFEDDFRAFLNSQRIDSSAMDYNDAIHKMVVETTTLYEEAITEINNEGKCIIYKFGSGNYYSAKPSDTNSYETRRSKITGLIKKASNSEGQFNINGTWYSSKIDFNKFENLIFDQFPKIYLFNEQYSLKDSLPNRIETNWREEGNNFEKRFIEYLGSDKVNRILEINDPRERREIEKFLNNRVKLLIDKVNESRSVSDKQDLLEILLDVSPEGGIQITLYTDGKPSFYSHLSENTKFLFAYHLYTETEDIEKSILLFDEPNNGFHPTAQRQMLRFLQELGKKGNLVIVSTHSEYLIDPDYLASIRLMSSDENNYIFVKNHFYSKTGKKGDYHALQPIFDAIGYKYGNQLEIENKVIITEGITDLLYLRAFNKILGINLDLHIAPARGEPQIPHLISFLISQELSFKILIDTGIMKSHIQTDFGIEENFIYEIPIPITFAGKVEGSGIEDLFSKNDFEKLINKVGFTTSKQFPHRSNSSYLNSKDIDKFAKRLIAHYFYENVDIFKKSDFEKETINNFIKVLEFCENSDWFSI